MKKGFIVLMVMTWAVAGNIYAQDISKEADRPFYIPPGALMDSFHIKLDRGNSMQIELTDLADMKMLMPADSMIKRFQNDIKEFEDSLSDPLSIKSIWYLTNESGRTYIRLQQWAPRGKNYVLLRGHKSPMKIQEDTVRIIRVLPGKDKYFHKRYLAATFYLNDFHQLFDYENAQLDSVMTRVYAAARKQTHWTPANNHNLKLTSRYSLADALAGKKAAVHPRYRENDYLTLLLSASLQNVHQYFSPSTDIGLVLGFPKEDLTRELMLFWEPMFLFEKNDQGVLQTYRNDWLVAGYAIHTRHKKLMFTGNFSIGYLIRRKGPFFDNNTFRLGLGGIDFGGSKASLQPILYFHGLFKGVTPGLRLSVGL